MNSVNTFTRIFTQHISTRHSHDKILHALKERRLPPFM